MLRALAAALVLTTATVASAQDRGEAAYGQSTVFGTNFVTAATVLAVPVVVFAATAAAVDDNDDDNGNPTPTTPGTTTTTTSTRTR